MGNPERAGFGSFFPHRCASHIIISNRWVHGTGPCFPCLNWCKSLSYKSFFEIVREVSNKPETTMAKVQEALFPDRSAASYLTWYRPTLKLEPLTDSVNNATISPELSWYIGRGQWTLTETAALVFLTWMSLGQVTLGGSSSKKINKIEECFIFSCLRLFSVAKEHSAAEAYSM